MNDEEYERRKRALDEMYQADLLLVRAAHEVRLRCLEALRQTEAPGGLPESQSPPPPAPAPRSAPARPSRHQNPDLKEAILEALPRLPEVFTKQDVVHALGFTPSRSSLQRILMDLDAQKVIRFAVLSEGRRPTTYRKV